MQKFKDIFEGNNSAYGQLILTGETSDKGKAVGKAFIKSCLLYTSPSPRD